MRNATYYSKGTARKIDTAFAQTDLEAAAALFAKHPKCQSVQCCNAYQDTRGQWQTNGSDIRWIDRRNMSEAMIAAIVEGV